MKVVDNVADGKIASLELKNSILQRRLNRSDIIIRGLPNKIKNLREPIKRICSQCNVQIYDYDIQHCTYFAGGKAVLVKFNSVQIRDQIMINYNRSRNLLLKNIVRLDDNSNLSRIFLSDHLTDAAKKLVNLCRKLKTDGKILRYKFVNYDIPKAKVVKSDQTEVLLSYDDCINLSEGRGDLSDISFSSVNNSILANAHTT